MLRISHPLSKDEILIVFDLLFFEKKEEKKNNIGRRFIAFVPSIEKCVKSCHKYLYREKLMVKILYKFILARGEWKKLCVIYSQSNRDHRTWLQRQRNARCSFRQSSSECWCNVRRIHASSSSTRSSGIRCYRAGTRYPILLPTNTWGSTAQRILSNSRSGKSDLAWPHPALCSSLPHAAPATIYLRLNLSHDWNPRSTWIACSLFARPFLVPASIESKYAA